MKVTKIEVQEAWDYDKLYPILQDAYRVLYISYQNLCKEKQIHPYTKPKSAKNWHLEDEITDDLTKNEENLPKNFEYRIINQQKDATKKSRIDIAIQWSLRFGQKSDIKIECKLLKQGNLDYIISGGITKFKNNLYAEEMDLAGMLFYNTSGLMVDNIKKLNDKIENKISKAEILKQYKILDNYQFTYRSNHKRLNNSDITLYSCVFDFVPCINNSEND